VTFGALFRAFFLFFVTVDAVGVHCCLMVLLDFVGLLHLLVGLGYFAEITMAVAAFLDRIALFQL